jgi:hypothetical protein
MSSGLHAVNAAILAADKEGEGYHLRITLKSGGVVEGPHSGFAEGARVLVMDAHVQENGETVAIATYVPLDEVALVQVIW